MYEGDLVIGWGSGPKYQCLILAPNPDLEEAYFLPYAVRLRSHPS